MVVEIERMKEVAEQVFGPEEEIVLCYLYGSAARGELREGSDVDVGVVLCDDAEPDPLYEPRLARRFEELLDVGREVEVRILNGRGSVFLNQVVRDGCCIYKRSEDVRHRFERDVMKKYADYKPFMRMYNEARYERRGIYG
jgi:predicted nucleotidyltransferase